MKRKVNVSAGGGAKNSKQLKYICSGIGGYRKKCLFCWSASDCALKEEESEQQEKQGYYYDKYSELEGAEEECVLFRRQLCHWFIIRKLLDIPKHWCESKLTTLFSPDDAENENDKNCGGPGSWFHVCKECLNTFVLEAWRVHDQILKLEQKMSKIKAKVKRRIKNSHQSGLLIQHSSNEQVALEIREIVVSEIEEQVPQEKVVLVKMEQMNEPPILFSVEEAILDGGVDEELPFLQCESKLLNDLVGVKFDDDNDVDDDPNDDNWTPSGEDDEMVFYNNEQQAADKVADLGENEAVKKFKTRGKDKGKRKSVKRGPYKKRVRDAQTCLRSKRRVRKVKVAHENDNGDSTESSSAKDQADIERAKKGTGQRGKDKQKRKPKPRVRKDRPPKIITFPCNLCSCKPFLTSEELEFHKNLHEQRNTAKMNGVHTLDKLNCEKCSFPAQDTIELGHHIRFRHDLPEATARQPKYQCSFCPKIKKCWADMLQHLKAKHKTETPEDIDKFKDQFLKCDLCGFRGEIPRHLILHKRRHEKQETGAVPARLEDCRECEECGQIFDNEKGYKIHVANTHKRVDRYVCDICGAGFPFPGKLNIHRLTHVKNLKKEWICSVCGADFGRKYSLNKHCIDFHPEILKVDDPTLKKGSASAPAAPAATGTTTTSNEKIFKCRYCDLTSPYNSVIRRHLQTHKQQGEHECQKCGKYYMNAQGLKRHLKINHNESGERFPCPHCKREFPSTEYMMVHVKRFCKIKELLLGNN